MDRLLMLDAHIRTRNVQEIMPEFPRLIKHERTLWERSDFQRLPYRLVEGPLQLELAREPVRRLRGPFLQRFMHTAADTESTLAQQLRDFLGGTSTDIALITSLSLVSAIEGDADGSVLYAGPQYGHPSTLPAELVLQVEAGVYTWVILPHIDHTSGSTNNVANLTAFIREVSPQTKVAVDVSDTIGIEKIEFSAWGVDAVFSAAPSCHLALVTENVDVSQWGLITAKAPEALTSLLGTASRLEVRLADVEAIKKELADTYELTLAPTETIALSIVSKVGVVRHFGGLINEIIVPLDVLVAKLAPSES